WPHEIDNEQRDRLHGEDERLIDAALARLVPSLQAAPDGDEGAGKTCQPAGETAEKSGACVRQRSGPQGSARPAQEEIAGIDDQQTSDDMPIGAARKLQQQIASMGTALPASACGTAPPASKNPMPRPPPRMLLMSPNRRMSRAEYCRCER